MLRNGFLHRAYFLILLVFSLFSPLSHSATLAEVCPYGYPNPPNFRMLGFKYDYGVSLANCESWRLGRAGAEASASCVEYARSSSEFDIVIGYYWVSKPYCGTTPADDAMDDGCSESQLINGKCPQSQNNHDCYSSQEAGGGSYSLTEGKRCSDYCQGPAIECGIDPNTGSYSCNNASGPTGSAKVHVCNANDSGGSALGDTVEEAGHGCTGTGVSDSGPGTDCGNGTGDTGTGDSGSTGTGTGDSGSTGTGDSGSTGTGDSGSTGTGDSGTGGTGSGGTSISFEQLPADSNADGSPDGWAPADIPSCDGDSSCVCNEIVTQCYRPDPDATSNPTTCPTGQTWSAITSSCVTDLTTDPDPDPTACPTGKTWSTATNSCVDVSTSCPSGQIWSTTSKMCVADFVDNPDPDAESTADDSLGVLKEILGKLGLMSTKSDDAANTQKIVDAIKGIKPAESTPGECDPEKKGYLECLTFGYTKEDFDFEGYASQKAQEYQAKKQQYTQKIDDLIKNTKDKIKLNASGGSDPFYNDERDVFGVSVDFGIARFADVFQYLPALIMFAASVSAAFIVLGGVRK